MGQSYRIRTELGVNKTINVQLDQQFEFLEILSLTLQQEDIYIKSCSQYGVVVGRVTANNGFGIPNARVSIFIPITPVDESNPIISSIYPYKSPNDINEDGYRYNLLPYEKSYSSHSATGTLPSRLDTLTGSTAVEIYDKYYKYTAKTNESGDYMIMGVPQGNHTLVMDVDLSDIGEFSLTPQDLIRMGLATEAQVAGNRFRTSTDLNSLPQIINVVKDVQVSPLWGDPELCDIAINRVDYDLREDSNIDIQPTSVFMGSIYSTSDSYRVRPNAKPPDDMGNLCSLTTGPGQILAIRQTIYQDNEGNPVLEQHQLEQSGNIIDGNGVWLTELPMNLDYFITNEFGEKVLSNDPTVGIPTKAKYRFKIKWSQSPNLSEQVRRAYYLVPNVKEYNSSGDDPNPNNPNLQLESSYYFGLAWSGYTNGFSAGTQKNNRLNEIINCEDTFYEFQFNKVYTVSGLIDQFKNGGRGRFIGIKEIDSQDCETTVNKFPVNEGFRNFDLLYFIFAIILQVIQIIGVPLLIIYHFLAFLWNNFAVILLAGLIVYIGSLATKQAILIGLTAAASVGFTFTLALTIAGQAAILVTYLALLVLLTTKFTDIVSYVFGRLKLPMMTYPDCQACECDPEATTPGGGDTEQPPQPGILLQTSNPMSYYNTMTEKSLKSNGGNEDGAAIFNPYETQWISGRAVSSKNPLQFKSTQSQVVSSFNDNGFRDSFMTQSVTLPIGERINLFNTRRKFFEGLNKIKVTFNQPGNINKFHYDNTLIVLGNQVLEPGTLLTFVNPGKSTDRNFTWTGTTGSGVQIPLRGICGVFNNKQTNLGLEWVNPNHPSNPLLSNTTQYFLPEVESECYYDITVDVIESGTTTYLDCSGIRYKIPETPIGQLTIKNENGINISSIGGTAIIDDKKIVKGIAFKRYEFPLDIEYCQVLTAVTITLETRFGQPFIKTNPEFPLTSAPESFWNIINRNQIGYYLQDNPTNGWRFGNTQFGAVPVPPPFNENPLVTLDDLPSKTILILQRGVDPYSPKYINRYQIGNLFGSSENDPNFTFTASTRLNVPIQSLPQNSTISVQNHKNSDEIFYPSVFFEPGIPSSLFPVTSSNPGYSYSSYTTSNVGYYGALDKTWFNNNNLSINIAKLSFSFYANGTINQGNGVTYTYGVTTISNDTGIYSVSNLNTNQTPNTRTVKKSGGITSNVFNYNGPYYIDINNPPTTNWNYLRQYRPNDDLSGAALMYRAPWTINNIGSFNYNSDIANNAPYNLYYSPILYPQFTATTGPTQSLLVANKKLNIMRTDRLPSSDYLDNDFNYNGSTGLLQQNLGFAMYSIDGNLNLYASPGFSTGAQQPTADIGGQYAAINVFTSLNTCEQMVGLKCYEGDGTNFRVKDGCRETDPVESGCYVMVRKPLTDLTKDLGTFAEWGYRFRFNYGLCRGVLAQSFTNNWVNGSLYMFPLQVDTSFNLLGEARSIFAKQLVYFDKKTNTFYYRSSPYNGTKFIGRSAGDLEQSVNRRNLLFPTTIVNLGMKDDIYQEILFEPSSKGYIMKSLNPSSYSDTSDLVNLFVISRITTSKFLTKILSGFNNSLNELFSRGNRNVLRIDGDLAQAMSINSEFGVIPFSPQFYNTNENPSPVNVVGYPNNPTIGIFFSSTTFDLQNKDYLSPGIINFRPSNNVNAITYQYGIKSQEVPFYKWSLNGGTTIFGSEKNNWATNESDIFSQNYQSLSRRTNNTLSNPSYFMGSNVETPAGPNVQPLGDIYQRGYLFGVDSNGKYSNVYSNEVKNFLVSAPNHFYFGIIKGESALDKFKTKYSVDE
jgi:hypothetical protein